MSRTFFTGYEATRGYDGTRIGDRLDLDGDALVRHAFVCGSTGSGKTVLCKALVEEAICAGVPVIAVDFKGDIASLALDERLQSEDALQPIVGDAAAPLLREYRDGLAGSRAAAARAGAFSERVEPRIFTPYLDLGERVSISSLPSFPDPPVDALEGQERERVVHQMVQALGRTLFGQRIPKKHEAEVKLLEELVRWATVRGENLDGAAGIERLRDLVMEPPFDSVAGLPIDAYVGPNQRQRLVVALTNRLVGVERHQYDGRPLDVETLIGGVAPGRTPLSVVYMGHESGFEQQALVLAQVCMAIHRWMRRKGGGSGLELLLYVDEIGGGDNAQAFYPSHPFNPVSKSPLNLLVKQGRSYGVGVLLATQNPASVDVRGLGNLNTVALGRLTQRNDLAKIEPHLSDAPRGANRVKQELGEAKPGIFYLRSDGLGRPRWIKERWLYTVHTQLAPKQVGALHRALVVRGRPSGQADPLPSLQPSTGGRLARERSVVPTPQPSEPLAPDVVHYDLVEPQTGETADLSDDGEPTTLTLPLEGSDREWLVRHAGRETVVRAGEPVTIGRSRSASLKLDDPHISRLHVEVDVRGGRLWVRALQTKNPTWLEGEVLDGEQEVSVEGRPVSLRVGKTELTLEER